MARILVIDDEANIRMMLRMALQKDGHTVEPAADGPEGLAKYGDGSAWDLVLLDQRMPGMEGLEVLGEIRRRNSDARVIMITAFGTIDLAVDAMQEGATDFLRKPFTLEALRGSVRSALEGRTGTGGVADEGTLFSFATLNGFRIESRHQPGEKAGADRVYHLAVHAPTGERTDCEVVLPAQVREQVKARAEQEPLPGGDLFWQGLCEEALANYVWQNAGPPPDGTLRVEEFTTGLRRWTDTVLAART